VSDEAKATFPQNPTPMSPGLQVAHRQQTKPLMKLIFSRLHPPKTRAPRRPKKKQWARQQAYY